MTSERPPLRRFTTAADMEAREQRELEAFRLAFPDWCAYRLAMIGWLIVPKGTPWIINSDLDPADITVKIEQQREDKS